MKVKTSDLTGPALDWAVAKCEGCEVDHDFTLAGIFMPGWFIQMDSNYWKPFETHTPSTNWAQGGPIVDRGRIFIRPTLTEGGYRTARSVDAVEARIELPNGATVYDPLKVVCEYGPTPLIASMRAYVASKLGEEVEVPEELLESTKRSTK